jgi:hypothetical protein
MKTILLLVYIVLILNFSGCAVNEPRLEIEATREGGSLVQEKTPSPVMPERTVDLGKITPQSTITEEMKELPEPGIPNPGIHLVNKAKQDLAERLDLDVSDINLHQQTEVDWNDNSLGCPQPGEVYQPVLISGYRFTFEVGGMHYVYHTDLKDQIILCEIIEANP